jgi:hypothetical protein
MATVNRKRGLLQATVAIAAERDGLVEATSFPRTITTRRVTDEEKKRVLRMILVEIRADHTVDGLRIEFRPKPIWEPYVEAVLARHRQEQATSPAVTTAKRKTGTLCGHRCNKPIGPQRARMATVGGMTRTGSNGRNAL